MIAKAFKTDLLSTVCKVLSVSSILIFSSTGNALPIVEYSDFDDANNNYKNSQPLQTISGSLEFFGIADSVYDKSTLTGIDFGSINPANFSLTAPDGNITQANGLVSLATGDFASSLGFFSSVNLFDFELDTINPASLLMSGGGFDFHLESASITDNGGANIDLIGSGYVTHNNYAATRYSWAYSATTQMFSAIINADGEGLVQVPEPRMFLILMTGLLGLLLSRWSTQI